MSRNPFYRRPPKEQTATLMMRLTPSDREKLHAPAIAAWEDIRHGTNDPERGREVLFRINYVSLAANNYEEEFYLRVLTSIAKAQIRDYVYRVRHGFEHVFSEVGLSAISEALEYAAQYDEDLTRKAILGYYNQVTQQLLRDPVFTARLS